MKAGCFSAQRYGVGAPSDLSPYDGDDLRASRSAPFERGEMMRTSLLHNHLHLLLMIQLLLKTSPMMRS
jgi:hypothetical protein